MSDTGPPDASPKAEDQTEAPAAMEAAEAPTKKVPEPISFREFLESTPPGRMADVARVCEHKRTQASTYQFFELIAPDIRLHCPSADCKGMLYFRFIDGNRTFGREDKEIETFMTYRCSNCRNTTKRYSLYVERKSDFDGKCYKFGELPAFGPVTPTRLLDLFGKDRDIFLKGRRCESQGLGIGAFVYYRRVVESHRIKFSMRSSRFVRSSRCRRIC